MIDCVELTVVNQILDIRHLNDSDTLGLQEYAYSFHKTVQVGYVG